MSVAQLMEIVQYEGLFPMLLCYADAANHRVDAWRGSGLPYL